MATIKKQELSGKLPQGLDFLFSDVQYLKGVGPKKGEALKKYGVKTVFDLFYYVPRKYLDRSLITPLNKIEEGMTVTVLGTVVAFGELRRRRRLFKVIIEVFTGRFFGG